MSCLRRLCRARRLSAQQGCPPPIKGLPPCASHVEPSAAPALRRAPTPEAAAARSGANPPHSRLRHFPPSIPPPVARQRTRLPHGAATSPGLAVTRPPPIGVAELPRRSRPTPFIGRNRVLDEPLAPLRPFPGRGRRRLAGIPADRATLCAKDDIARNQDFLGCFS
jgi:hypothetical protein